MAGGNECFLTYLNKLVAVSLPALQVPITVDQFVKAGLHGEGAIVLIPCLEMPRRYVPVLSVRRREDGDGKIEVRSESVFAFSPEASQTKYPPVDRSKAKVQVPKGKSIEGSRMKRSACEDVCKNLQGAYGNV